VKFPRIAIESLNQNRGKEGKEVEGHQGRKHPIKADGKSVALGKQGGKKVRLGTARITGKKNVRPRREGKRLNRMTPQSSSGPWKISAVWKDS